MVRKPANGGKLTTFFGVFVPCVLSIFSVILFLRMGYILGQAGLIVTLVMLTVAYTIVVLTILSISAISTNGLVRGGGAYYMISRSLGPEFGGAIGIIFFFANIFACGLYVAGFVEALTQNIPQLPSTYGATYGLSSAVLALCLIVCMIGAGAFSKASFVIFLVVMISTFSCTINFLYAPSLDDISPPVQNQAYNGTLLYTGFNQTTWMENSMPSFTVDYTTGVQQNVFMVFGVLFNGCTGIMAGANMSGDLKNPSESIPKGTLQATAFTFVVYVLLFTLTAGTTSRDLLQNNFGYLQDINTVPPLVLMGIFAATLSAALSTMIGASRILQAISRDQLLGEWSAYFSKEKTEPIRAVLLSWLLVQLVLLIGQINIIAPIVSMLFLLSYAITNFACFVLKVTGAPNFRPRFRTFSWHTALAGFVSCVAVMFFIDPLYATASILLMIVMFCAIHFRQLPVSWGDVSQALIYHQVRKYLLRLEAQCVKYWRPQILMLVVNPRSSFNAVQFANQMKKGGLFVLGHVVTSEVSAKSKALLTHQMHGWHELDRIAKIKAFVECTISPSIRLGIQSLIMSSGLGGMKPNILLLGFYRESSGVDELVDYRQNEEERQRKMMFSNPKRVRDVDTVMSQFLPLEESRRVQEKISAKDYVGVIVDALTLGKNVGIFRNFAKLIRRIAFAKAATKSGDSQWYIDVWPVVPRFGSSRFTYEILLQLGTIVRMVQKWEKITKLRIVTIVETQAEASGEFERVSALCVDLRIEAKIEVIAMELQPAELISSVITTPRVGSLADRHKALNALMKVHCHHTCVAFTYLPEPPANPDQSGDYIAALETLTDGLPPTILMRGIEEVVTLGDVAV